MPGTNSDAATLPCIHPSKYDENLSVELADSAPLGCPYHEVADAIPIHVEAPGHSEPHLVCPKDQSR